MDTLIRATLIGVLTYSSFMQGDTIKDSTIKRNKIEISQQVIERINEIRDSLYVKEINTKLDTIINKLQNGKNNR